MNELNTRLLEYLPDPNTVKGGLGGIVETLQVEAPVLVNEILRWSLVKNGILFIAWSVLLVFSINKFRSVWKSTGVSIGKQLEKSYPDIFTECLVRSLFFLSVLVTLIASMASLTWLKVLIAPRLFLLEYISSILT